MLTKSLFPRLLFVFFFAAAGCSGAGETAVVTERPEVAVITERPDPVSSPAGEGAPVSDPSGEALGAGDVRAGRFDLGKMWTFDNPPLDYFEEAYGFRPDEAWLERARLGALRFADYCSASFVSPNGLVLTNHHCARESITDVSRTGEDLLRQGFYAEELEQERKVPELYVDQLILIEDVTENIDANLQVYADAGQRAQVIRERIEALERRKTSEAKGRDSTLYVQVISLYDGGQYSAYTYRRYEDVRLVMAPELQLGFFGGEPDNFTYPRYALDMSLFRVYTEAGEPLETEHYFPWSERGTQSGAPVFVVGNPGTTSRLLTVSQLRYERDYGIPQELELLRVRAELLKAYLDAHPEEAKTYDLENTYFSLMNSIKAKTGELEGLRDPDLIARRAAAERELRRAFSERDTLRRAYGGVLGEVEELQRSKEAMTTQARAFTLFGSTVVESHVLLRALYGYIYDFLSRRGAPGETIREYREEGLKVENWPAEVEEAFLAARLRGLQEALGASDPTLRRVLQGRTPEVVAERVVSETALIDSAGFAQALEKGYLSSGDATVPLIEALAPLYFQVSQQFGDLEAREQSLAARLARARFELTGPVFPPDATLSLRIADGVVQGYTYNGTYAPPFTTFYGLYNHYYSYGPDSAWDLPEEWLEKQPQLDRSTPLNLVSTNDITGGNSGSPLLSRDLEVVGLIFDSNIDALPNTFLYTDETARAVSVDARGILESLDAIYDADRLVVELTTGELVPTEAAAEERLP